MEWPPRSESLSCGTSIVYATTTAPITAAVTHLIDRVAAGGAIRLERNPLDLLRALSSVANTDAARADQNAKRLIDVLIAGLWRF